MMEETSQESMQQPFQRNTNSEKPKPPNNLLQELSIEKYRLDYLRKCKKLKRPPQSLRVSGCNALKTERFSLLSEVETKALLIAIENNVKDINKINNTISNSTVHMAPFSIREKKQWYKHFQNKIKFYKSQETTKWKDLPHKTHNTHYQNKKKKLNKKTNKIKQKAQKILETKQVRILVDMEVPMEAVAVLGKGLGFVPTPQEDIEEIRLDGRRVCNQLSALDQYGSNNTQPTIQTSNIPSKLKPINYATPQHKVKNPIINQAINVITTKLNALNIQHKTGKNHTYKGNHNLSHLERRGLNWLKQKVTNNEIVITEADKGGSLLIVSPQLMENITEEKLNDESLFTCIGQDPRAELHNEMIDNWKEGKKKGFVTEKECIDVVGLTANNTKSTSSNFKPGITYFCPSLKIHKLEERDIIPGCIPPARLVSCLQEGVTKYSDVFVANKWLKSLESEFCEDLVKDTIDTLNWLEEVNGQCEKEFKTNLKPFAFDFTNLYDSLTPKLVLQALEFAISKCRPNWTPAFIIWLKANISHSMKSAVGTHKDKWYKPVKGIPTGGSLSVQLANITVYYVLHKVLYSNINLMQRIFSLKRFIDDGTGLFNGSIRQFDAWKADFVKALAPYGLLIKPDDWQVGSEPGRTVHFLDIMYTFSFEGELITDIYIKDTDSRTYLNFYSHHPKYIFSSIVYSQALRYRRIINQDVLLNLHLDELYKFFRLSDYPHSMILNIINKVKNTPRMLQHKQLVAQPAEKSIKVISTYGRDNTLCNITRAVTPMLVENKIIDKFRYIKKTAPSLKNTLSNSKQIALRNRTGHSVACGRTGGCKTCNLMSGNHCIISNSGTRVNSAPGNCMTRNIIYAATCQLCQKYYVGRSTQLLASRNNGHRAKYIRYGKQIANGVKINYSDLDDEYSLGIHLHDAHGIKDDEDGFDTHFRFTILENCNPRDLNKKEHLWIQKLRSIYPHGLNLNSPLGFPLLTV